MQPVNKLISTPSSVEVGTLMAKALFKSAKLIILVSILGGSATMMGTEMFSS